MAKDFSSYNHSKNTSEAKQIDFLPLRETFSREDVKRRQRGAAESS
jgi:hypothetical protein